jgi:hypothetical protein
VKLALLGLVLSAGAALAQTPPVLHFDPPKGFTGSLGRDPSAHVSMSGDAVIQVYPFRQLGVPFEPQFRRTLLREQLVHDSQEAKVAGAVEIQALQVAGADAAFFARFAEDRFGTIRYRLRVAVASRGAVAIVDYNANGADAYQRNWPALSAVLDSLRVGGEKPAPARAEGPGQKGGASDGGLFLAQSRRFVMRIGGAPGSGDWEVSTRFYLLANGRFHRGYGLPSVQLRNFDFAKAEREDPANTGAYSIKGSKVSFRTRSGDAMEGTVTSSQLSVESTQFKKSALKQ